MKRSADTARVSRSRDSGPGRERRGKFPRSSQRESSEKTEREGRRGEADGRKDAADTRGSCTGRSAGKKRVETAGGGGRDETKRELRFSGTPRRGDVTERRAGLDSGGGGGGGGRQDSEREERRRRTDGSHKII